MKVLVTGSAGFIGSHVTRLLVEQGFQVRALHLPNENLYHLQGLDVETMAGDITDVNTMRKACKGCQRVFHLAAIYALWLKAPRLMRRVNVEGSRIVLEAAKAEGVERVIYTSSIARFGGQGLNHPATELSPFALANSGSEYAITKAEGHEIAVAAARNGQDVVIVAPTGPIGPGDIGPTPTGKLLLTCAKAPVVTIPPTRSNFCDVRDIAQGHVLAAEKGRSGESYLLGHRDLSIQQLAEITMQVLGVKRRIVTVPFSLAEWTGKAAYWHSEHINHKPPIITHHAVAIARKGLTADCSKAVIELGLPQSPIEKAVADALEWFHQYRHGSGQRRRAS